jgi:hypothetical protein
MPYDLYEDRVGRDVLGDCGELVRNEVGGADSAGEEIRTDWAGRSGGSSGTIRA